MPPSINDLQYAYFGGSSSLADAAYAYYLAAYTAGVTGSNVIGGAYTGTGNPEGVVTAPVGSMYRDKTPGAPALYIKTSGTGNTGWELAGSSGGVGPQGFQGATGVQGSQGSQGAQGTTGSTGSTGSQGAQGSTGSQGSQGATGSQGSQGSTGAQGSQGSQGAQGVGFQSTFTANRFIGRKNGAGNGAAQEMTGAEGAAILAGNELSATDFVATGLTGATAASRYVGGTTSLAPASGTFAVGDAVVDQTGQLWICTVAGSPGTWVAAGSGRQLAYAEISTTPGTFTAVGSGSRVDLDSGLTITFTPSSRPVLLRAWFGQVANNTATDGVGLAIVDGTIGGGTGTQIQQGVYSSATAGALGQITIQRVLSTLTPGVSKTYKIMAWVITGGTGTVTAGTALRPFIEAVEE